MFRRETHPSILLLLLGACSQRPKMPENPWASNRLKLEAYRSCDDFKKDIKERSQYLEQLNAYYQSIDTVEDMSTIAKESAQRSSDQVPGVFEGDRLAESAELLFFAHDEEIAILDRQTLEDLGKITIRGKTNMEMIVSNSQLIVLATDQYESTWLGRYSLSGRALPTLRSQHSFPGSYATARLQDQVLSLITHEWLPFDDAEKGLLRLSSESKSTCQNILKPMIGDFDQSTERIFGIELKENSVEISEPLVILGAGGHHYASKNAIYILKNFYDTIGIDSTDLMSTSDAANFDLTGVVEISWPKPNDLVAKLKSGIEVSGILRDRYSVAEIAYSAGDHPRSLLYLATSVGWNGYNLLTTLENDGSKLNQIYQSAAFGRGEDIRSVRFVGKKAYIVTFRQVDPLFTFDLSNPDAAELTGELEVPGFSHYLHPIGDDRLIGIGLGAPADGNPFQVSLFDISGPAATRLDVDYRGYYAHSEVFWNPHAFSMRKDATEFAVPLSVDRYSADSFDGAVIYSLANDQIHLRALLSHTDMYREPNLSIAADEDLPTTRELGIHRITTNDSHWISFSDLGVRSHPFSNPDQIDVDLRFD